MITNLKNLTIVNPNYIACLMWKDQYSRVYRYKLWEDVGETTELGFPLYAGQLIMKNFRIEIWSINGQNVTETVGQSIITSVLQGIDYRYGTDAPLSGNDGEVLNFSAQAGVPDNYPVFNNLQARWTASNLVSGQPWISVDGFNRSLVGFNSIQSPLIFQQNVADVIGNGFVFPVNPTITPAHTFMLVYIPNDVSGGAILYKYQDTGMGIGIDPNDSTTATLSAEDGSVVNVPYNQWIIIEVGYSGDQSFLRYIPLTTTVYPLPTFVASTTNPTASANFGMSGIGGEFYCADIEVFNTYLGQGASQEILTYFNNRYNFNFPLPLVFPANSTPQPNTI